MKKYILEALIIVVLALFLALATNGLRRDRLPLTGGAQSGQADQLQNGLSGITIEAAVAEFERGGALFADARTAANFAAGHIAGAVNLPAQQPELWMEKVLASVDPDQTVITYCDGAACPLGKELARLLSDAGFERVFYLVDGWGQWKARGLPTGQGQ